MSLSRSVEDSVAAPRTVGSPIIGQFAGHIRQDMRRHPEPMPSVRAKSPLLIGSDMQTSTKVPLIVGLGGSTRSGSSTERAVRLALDNARETGAEVVMFDGPFLASLPIFAPEIKTRTSNQRELIDTIARCDGIIVGSPGYHGSISGLIKNALDTLEELSRSTPVYLDGRAFGSIVTAYGWQACGTTLVTLRTIAHALRAWPTPMGVTLNAAFPLFDQDGQCIDEKVAAQLKLLATQVLSFARNTAAFSSLPQATGESENDDFSSAEETRDARRLMA